MKGKLIILWCTSLLFSCGSKFMTKQENEPQPIENALDSLEWFIGRWEMYTESIITVELWEQLNDSVLNGYSYSTNAQNDTLFSERITIEKRGPFIYYIPLIKDQNEGNPTLFKRSKLVENQVTFENSAHDFPQIIKYERKGDSLIAEISGITDGIYHAERFPMVKVTKKAPIE